MGNKKNWWKIKKAEEICKQYANGNYTIESCCEAQGIPSTTFYDWIKKIGEIGETYIKAKNIKASNRKKYLKGLAITALEKKLKGWKTEQIIYEGKNEQEQKIKKIVKEVPPDSACIIFTLINMDPEHFKDKKDINVPAITSLADLIKEKIKTHQPEMDKKTKK